MANCEEKADSEHAGDAEWRALRPALLRDAIGVGLAVGALGLSFGALAVVAGFTVLQTSALSVLMFSGASQFALIGVVGPGGGALAGAATAGLLGIRNSLYGLHLSPLLKVRGRRRALAAHLVLDESAGMAMGRPTDRAARFAFWATGTAVFVCWNVATLIGATGVRQLPDPSALGLDVAGPAAFVALLVPRLRGGRTVSVALVAAAAALGAAPFLPAGVPVLMAGPIACVAAFIGVRKSAHARRNMSENRGDEE